MTDEQRARLVGYFYRLADTRIIVKEGACHIWLKSRNGEQLLCRLTTDRIAHIPLHSSTCPICADAHANLDEILALTRLERSVSPQ